MPDDITVSLYDGPIRDDLSEAPEWPPELFELAKTEMENAIWIYHRVFKHIHEEIFDRIVRVCFEKHGLKVKILPHKYVTESETRTLQ